MIYKISVAQLIQSILSFFSGVIVVNTFGESIVLNEYYVIFSLFTVLASFFSAPVLQSYTAFQRENLNCIELIENKRKKIVRYGALSIAVWVCILLFLNKRLELVSPEFNGITYFILILCFAIILVISLLVALDTANLLAKGKFFHPIFFSYLLPVGIMLSCLVFGVRVGVTSILIGFGFGTLGAFILVRDYNTKQPWPSVDQVKTNPKIKFATFLVKGTISILPLITIGPIFLFFVAQNTDFSVVYYTIPIGFAGVVSIITSYGKFLVKISSAPNLNNENTMNSLYKTVSLAIMATLFVSVIFKISGELIYKVEFDKEKYSVFNLVLISGVFISGYNIIRADDWQSNLGKMSLIQPLLLILAISLLYSTLYSSLTPVYLATLYSLTFLILFCVRLLTLHGLSKATWLMTLFSAIVYGTLFLMAG